MIFERRAYTFRPGNIQPFWDAQLEWNTEAVFGPIRRHVISYFSTTSGPQHQVVHLYGFASLDEWHTTYANYYATQNPDYFALVRSWMLAQENTFLSPAPHAELAAGWTGDPPRLPAALRDRAATGDYCVVETTLAFFPGGLPAYWKACGLHRLHDDAPGRSHLMAELFTLIGPLHRVRRYEAFASEAEAHAELAARSQDPKWQAFAADYAPWIAGQEVLYLRPSPLESRRLLV